MDKVKNSAILSVIHHRQNPLESEKILAYCGNGRRWLLYNILSQINTIQIITPYFFTPIFAYFPYFEKIKRGL
jgi:hypothetical protein